MSEEEPQGPDGERDRTMVHKLLEALLEAYPEGQKPGFVALIMCEESPSIPGMIEVDASVRGGDCFTEQGKAGLTAFSRALRTALESATASLAGPDGEVIVVDPRRAPRTS